MHGEARVDAGDKTRLKAALAMRAVLSDTMVFSFLALSYHWNVRGRDFHEMHGFFEGVYEEADAAVDGVAETVAQLGYEAPKTLHDVLRDSSVPQERVDNDSQDLVSALYRANKRVIDTLRGALSLADSCGDPALAELVRSVATARLEAHAKWDWQMGAMLGRPAEDPDSFTPAPLPMMAAADDDAGPGARADASCPPATQDVVLNLENRKKAIDGAMYGPLNPAEPNDDYWRALAGEWSVDADTARRQTCGNCAMFSVSAEMKACIEAGVTGDRDTDAFDAVDAAGELGYCEAFDFKCASARTCRAWVGGGPVTAAGAAVPELDAIPEQAAEAADFERGPCWEGYVQIGMKEVDGKQVPNCVPASEASGGHQAPAEAPSELEEPWVMRASIGRIAEAELSRMAEEHNRGARPDRATSAEVLAAVYRRGAHAYPGGRSRPSGRHEFAVGRARAYLRLLRTGRPDSEAYQSDNDLLLSSHPRAAGDAAGTLAELSARALGEMSVELLPRESYGGDERAILALAELSGVGYELEPALRASWVRAVRDGDDPFSRALALASRLETSVDSDLLPGSGRG